MDAEAAPVLVALPGTLCSPTVFEPLTAALAGAVTVDAGHTPVYETPGLVAAAVRDLVARVGPPPAAP